MITEINVNQSNPLPITTGNLQPPVMITGLQNEVEYTVTIVTHLKNGFTMTETRRLKPSQFATAGITPEQIQAMSTAEIVALGTDISILNPYALAALSSAQLHAITTAQAASFGSEDIAALDCAAFDGLTTGSLHAITTNAIQGLTTCQTQTLSSTDLNALSTNIANLSTTAVSSLTSNQIPGLSTSQIAALPNTSISALTSSAISGFTSAQVSAMTTANINALGPNITNLNTSAMSNLSTTQIQALTLAQVAALDSHDVSVLSTEAFNALTYAELAALTSDAVAGITAAQMATLSTADIVALGPDIANLNFDAMHSLTGQQFAALTTDQIAAFDVMDFAALSGSALSAMTPPQAAALTSSQVMVIDPAAFDYLSTACLAALTWDAVAGITAAQVDTLSSADIVALGDDIANLSTEAMASLDSTQIAAITTSQFAAFDSADIHALTSTAFDMLSTAALAALSSDAVAGITSEQVDTLDASEIVALGIDIANMPTDAMASLDSTRLHALTTEQFAAFDRYDIAALSSTAIAGLTSEQVAALSELAFDAFTLDDLAALSFSAVAGITPTQVDTLSTDDIQALGTDIANMGTAAMASLDSTQLRALTPAQLAAFDATDISALSSEAVYGLTSAQVAALSTSAFAAFTTAELAGLSYNAVAGITTAQIATLDTADIQALGSDISNLSSAAMASLDSTQVGVLTTGQIMAFDTADIRALGTQIANLSSAAIAKLTSTQIAALTTAQVAAFDSADIAAMSTDAFNALTTADLVALTSDAVVGITPLQVDTLSTADMVALGTDIANMNTAAMASLDSDQIHSLTTDQFAAFDATDVAALTSTALAGLTSTQIAAMSTGAFNAFTTAELDALTSDMVAGITSAQVGTLDTTDIQSLGVDIANLGSAAMASLSSTQIAALQNTQVAAFGTEDYAALGITGVTTTSMINLMQSVTAAKPSADVNSKTELQALSTAAQYIMTVAALDSSTTLSSQLSTMPTFKAHLILLGVTGVTDQNIKAIWVAVRDSVDSGSSVDTLAKLQAITDIANDSPILLPSATDRSYTEQATAVVLNNDLILSDVDNSNLVGATVTISSGYTTDDLLAFTAANGITGSFSQPTLTLTGTATVSEYQTALRSVTFYSSSDNPTATSTTRTFTWQVDDGTTADVTNLSDPATSTLTITPVNDAPTLDHALVNQSAAYNTAFTYQFAANTFSDVDNASLSYTSTLASGAALPSWLTFTGNTRTFSGTPLDTTDLSVKVIASDGSLTANGTFGIAIQPGIVSIAITSATGAQNNFVNAGDVVTSTVTFSEAVTVTGSPQLAMNIGGTTVQATYNTGSGTSGLSFNYTILAGQTDTNGISFDADALSLNGGTIKDANNNIAILTSSAVTDNSSYKVDTTAPSAPSAPTSYVDNVGFIQSTTSTASSTDDTTPGFNIGSGLTDTPKLYIDGSLVASTYDSVADTLTPTNALSDGTHSVTYTLTDAAGNESLPSSSFSITLDHTPPATPAIAPYGYINGNGDFSTATRSMYVLAIRVPIYSGVTYRLYGNDTFIDSTTAADPLDPTKNRLTITNGNYLTENTWVFKYTLVDDVGNESGKSPGFTVTNDTTANITNVTQSWGSTLNVASASSNGTVTATTAGVENGQIVTFTLNGINYTGTVSNNSASATVPSADLLNLSSSSYSVSASVSDVLGNYGYGTSSSFSVNFTPVIASVSSSWGSDGILSKTEKTSNGTVTVTTSNVINGKTLSVTINGVTHTASVSSNSATVTFTSAELTAMAGGTYTYDISVANNGSPVYDSSHSFKVLIFETLGDGDSTHGYWVAGSGSSKMIVAPKSVEATMVWGDLAYLAGTTSQTDGLSNSYTLWTNNQTAGKYAIDYNGNNPSSPRDWFLPARSELMTCLGGYSHLPSGQQFELTTGGSSGYYWSSTEIDADHASKVGLVDTGFSIVVSAPGGVKNQLMYVRPIRYTDANE